MKKRGILHCELSEALAGLGHAQTFLISDVGFPISSDIPRIDLALVKGILPFEDCLRAILQEVMVEEITIAKPMESYNAELYRYIMGLFVNQKKNLVDQPAFFEQAKQVKFVVRTGDARPYTNMILSTASGADEFNAGLDLL